MYGLVLCGYFALSFDLTEQNLMLFTQVGLLGGKLQLWLGQCLSFSQMETLYGLQEELKVWRESLKRTGMPSLQQVLCLQVLPC